VDTPRFLPLHHGLFIALFAISIPLKLIAAQHLAFDMDFVPIIARGTAFLDEGIFPAYGTLSSVAAYNLPFLPWLHLPALLITRDIAAVFILTGLAFNLLGTWAVYRLGGELFNPLVGLVAAALFTFSETSVSSSYTAWAQLYLPTFYALTMLFLWRWKARDKPIYATLAIITATAAFMTHFSAILLYPAILIFMLLASVRWHWRGILAGVFISALMGTPYLLFQIERDFVDLRAFLTRETLVEQAVLDRYADYKPGMMEREPHPTGDASSQIQLIAQSGETTPSRTERILNFAADIPGYYVNGLLLAFNDSPETLRGMSPILGGIASFFMRDALRLLFISGVMVALYRFVMVFRASDGMVFQRFQQAMASTAGRYLLLLLFVLVILSGLIVTRATPDSQPTYYTGFVSVQMVLAAASLVIGMQASGERLNQSPRWIHAALFIIVLVMVGFSSTNRILRVQQHDDETFSPFNAWVYASLDAAVDWMAADWQGGGTLAVSYDLFPEMAHFWWVAPWHTVDPLYGIGMSYDFMLWNDHRLRNTNDDPLGKVENADYIVTYETGLISYDLAGYTVQRFGAIHVLKPLP